MALPGIVSPLALAGGIALALVCCAPVRAQEDAEFTPTDDPRWVVVKYREGAGLGWDRGALRDSAGGTIELRGLAGQRLAVSGVFAPDAAGPDRSGIHAVVATRDAETSRAALRALRADPRVESAHVPKLPPPSPGGATPDFTGLQPHLAYWEGPPGNPPPSRLRPLHDIPGGTGRGVSFVDIEYAWRLTHEDLPGSIQVLGPTPRIPSGLNATVETNHGTASLGVVLAQHNALGVDGLAPDVTASVAGSFTDPSQPYEVNVARAIDRARTALGAGDVILLEAQIGGPRWTNPASQAGLVPVEWQQVVFDAIRAATDQGIIVVEAAGNGGEDLDDVVYQGKFNREQRDSRALIVTAAHAFPVPPGQSALFSNLGSRVDLYYWTYPLATAGYGDLQDLPGDDRDYSQSVYSASSAASALAAGGVASLQGIARALFGAPLAVAELGALLARTGAQDLGSGARFGVRPEILSAASELVWNRTGVDPATLGGLRNPSFEVLAGAGFSMPDGWLVTSGHAFSLAPLAGYGDIVPTHRRRLLSFEDETLDGVPVACKAGLIVPQSAVSVAIDWLLLATGDAAGDSCTEPLASLRLVDPATGAAMPLMTFPACLPLTTAVNAGSYSLGSGWRTSRSADLAAWSGALLEVHAEVRARLGGGGARRAALLLDNLRFAAAGTPSLTGVTPAQGPVCGGTTVVVTGGSFTAGDTRVQLGGVPLANAQWVDEGTILGEAPKGAAPGPVSVTVSSPGGSAALASGFTYVAAACGVAFRRGDCNDDGQLDMSDAIFALSFLFQGTRAPRCAQACDANGDDALDISDGVYVLDYLFRGARAPSAPFPGCGAAPSPSSLSCGTTSTCP